jgi:hypothetical protein
MVARADHLPRARVVPPSRPPAVLVMVALDPLPGPEPVPALRAPARRGSVALSPTSAAVDRPVGFFAGHFRRPPTKAGALEDLVLWASPAASRGRPDAQSLLKTTLAASCSAPTPSPSTRWRCRLDP